MCIILRGSIKVDIEKRWRITCLSFFRCKKSKMKCPNRRLYKKQFSMFWRALLSASLIWSYWNFRRYIVDKCLIFWKRDQLERVLQKILYKYIYLYPQHLSAGLYSTGKMLGFTKNFFLRLLWGFGVDILYISITLITIIIHIHTNSVLWRL